MNHTRDKLQRLLLAAALIVFLAEISCTGVSTEKGPSPDYPSLWERTDEDFQEALAIALRQEFRGQYKQAVDDKKVALVVVDITDLKNPKVASVNPDVMLYAASLPKIAILLGAFVQIERGEMTFNDETRAAMTRMIRNSTNKDATDILNQVGFENLAQILQSDKYRLYDLQRNGGLWVGRDYSGGPRWKGDPLHNISHGATAMQAARFYYLAETGRLVSDQNYGDFVEIMSKPGIGHKFVKGVQKSNPEAEILRKSGTWKNFHADSGIIVNKAEGYKYIIVALVEHPAGNDGLARFAMVVDQTMDSLYKSKN